jgi:hypothetical protein
MVTDSTASLVTHATLCGKVLKHWKNAVGRAKIWIFLDKEYKNCTKNRHTHVLWHNVEE